MFMKRLALQSDVCLQEAYILPLGKVEFFSFLHTNTLTTAVF